MPTAQSLTGAAPSAVLRPAWPLQSQLDAFYGDPRGLNGRASPKWERANLTHIAPPFRMTYASKPINAITIHRKCSDSLSRVLAAIWEAAKHDQKVVDAWGASIFGGANCYRLMRGGSNLSTHSWACAIDLDPARNAFHDVTPHFAEAPQVLQAFADEGWTWLGARPGRACDGMHWQATAHA